MKNLSRSRTAGLLATAGFAAALALPGAAFAQTGHPVPISDTSVSANCTGGPNGSDITPGAGQVAWLFVHANPDTTVGTLTATYTAAGVQTADSYIQGGVKYLVVTDGPDTITAFSDTISGGQLVLSHVCYGAQASESPSQPVQSEQPSSSPSEQPSEQPSTQPSESPSQPVESEQPSSSPSEQPSTQPSESPSDQPSDQPSSNPSEQPSSQPSGSVLGETGAPQLTPPPTDTTTTTSSNTGSGWQLLVLAASGIIASLLALTPATARKRR